MFELFKILFLSAFAMYAFTSVVIAAEPVAEAQTEAQTETQTEEASTKKDKSNVNERLDNRGDRKEARREQLTGNSDTESTKDASETE